MLVATRGAVAYRIQRVSGALQHNPTREGVIGTVHRLRKGLSESERHRIRCGPTLDYVSRHNRQTVAGPPGLRTGPPDGEEYPPPMRQNVKREITQYAIRNTQYAIRITHHASRLTQEEVKICIIKINQSAIWAVGPFILE